MKQGYIMMDVGGTNIKTAVLRVNGDSVVRKIFDAKSNETLEKIINNFLAIIKNLKKISQLDKFSIGMAFPGPFDYINGISYMKNLGKYDSIYGIPFKELLQKKLNDNNIITEIVFENDATAFGLGSAKFAIEKNVDKVLSITIGTGCGSAFIEKGKPAYGEEIPSNGWIYNTDFNNGIIDDYISSRGLMNIAEEYAKGKFRDGKEIFIACEEGDKHAIDIFDKFAKNIESAIHPFIKNFRPSIVIFGGEISKSEKYILRALRARCENVSIITVEDTSLYTMKGLIELMK